MLEKREIKLVVIQFHKQSQFHNKLSSSVSIHLVIEDFYLVNSCLPFKLQFRCFLFCEAFSGSSDRFQYTFQLSPLIPYHLYTFIFYPNHIILQLSELPSLTGSSLNTEPLSFNLSITST